MSLKDVLDNTQFVGYSPAEMNQLRSILTNVYNNSESGREMLEDGIVGPGIQISNVPNQAAAYAGTGRVELDLSYVNGLSAIDNTGTSFAFDNTYVLTHELVHAITGKRDLVGADRANGKHYTGFRDYEGETEIKTKEILDEMGINQYRASYDSAGRRVDLPIGSEYTQNESIDNAVVSHVGSVDTDHFFSTKRDLVIDASGGGQILQTGGGRDFIYGRAGNDTITPGSGDDFVDAGTGDDIIVEGKGSDDISGGLGFDTVDYSSMRGVGLASYTSGLNVTIDGNAAEVQATETFHSSVGYSPAAHISLTHTDTLTDVENIIGSSRNDVFTVENVSGNMYINGGHGVDTLTVTGAVASGYTLDKTDGVYPVGHELEGQAYNGTISNGTNTLYYSDIEDKDVTGFAPVTPEMPTEPSAPEAMPVMPPIPVGGSAPHVVPASASSASMSIEDAAGTLMTDIPIVQADLDSKEINGTITEEEMELARILETPMAPVLLKSLQDNGVEELDLTDKPMDTATARVDSLLQSSQEAFEAYNLPVPDMAVAYDAIEEQREEVAASRENEVLAEDSHSYDYA